MKKFIINCWPILLLTIFAACLLVPNFNFHPMLAQGDHGRDLYAFQQTLQGDKPYRDYWWVYGPLMPYYYASFLKIFGNTISSVLIGKSFLITFSTVIFYLILELIVSRPLALLASMWFILYNPPLFFTFNHYGAIPLMLIICYCVFKYLKSPHSRYLWLASFASILLGLVKINFGIANFVCFWICIYLIDKFNHNPANKHRRWIFINSSLILLISLTVIYIYFLWGLKTHEIRQCLPYLSADHPYHLGPLISSYLLIQGIVINIFSDYSNMAMAFLILVTLWQTICLIFIKKSEVAEKRNVALTIIILSLFYVFNLHEYLSSGVTYRWFWTKPFNMLLMFAVIGFGLRTIAKLAQFTLYGCLLLVITIRVTIMYDQVRMFKNHSQLLDLKKANIYVGNPGDWVYTVTYATKILNLNLKSDELFLALPYEPLYYYLTDKKSPTRQLIFFEHIKIPKQQEESIIEEIKNKNVRWVLISNRMRSFDEEGMGEFGVTYCPLLAKYIFDNFEEVAEIGNWKMPSGWAWNHAARIYRKKN